MYDAYKHGRNEGRTNSPARPRIGLDLHVVDDIYQGSRTHCLELFSRVVTAALECDFVVLAADPQKLLDFSVNFSSSNVSLVGMPHAAPATRLLWQLPRLVKQHGIDLLHTQYIVPPFSPCATAVTVHDVLFESHPEFFNKLFVLRSRLLVRQSVRSSAQVFTVSEFSRRQIAETFNIEPDKVHIILNGVDCARFFPGQAGREIAEYFGLEPGRYFLTVGRLEPRKNHVNLLRAWAGLGQPRPRLAIVGQRHFGYDEALNLIHTLQLERDIVFLEDVSDEQLPALFRNAKAFIYCSLAEGFGMPVLEAMASGVPVISSATTALSEICAKAALLVQPDDIDAISHAIGELDHAADIRHNLIGRGLSRVTDFSWEHSAAIVRDTYLRHFMPSTDSSREQGLADAEPLR
jgi:glycosyltransferase involved in cell wall biosynthesis